MIIIMYNSDFLREIVDGLSIHLSQILEGVKNV
jgi:hypothetical protein